MFGPMNYFCQDVLARPAFEAQVEARCNIPKPSELEDWPLLLDQLTCMLTFRRAPLLKQRLLMHSWQEIIDDNTFNRAQGIWAKGAKYKKKQQQWTAENTHDWERWSTKQQDLLLRTIIIPVHTCMKEDWELCCDNPDIDRELREDIRDSFRKLQAVMTEVKMRTEEGAEEMMEDLLLW